ncbi:MAG: HDOD domain-containing protein [Deltaproteobacteria bacterium]|nr:HDOD domain-containing protein [Deltaproteobacteria bacterium]MBN2671703.1 HDOD domain-containing protein [Deltaproteobacteria bacterium]
MTTSKNVVNQRGQILLPKNIELNDKHIQGLRSWSIKFVDVIQPGGTSTEELTEERKQFLTRLIDDHFLLNRENENNPLCTILKELLEEHLTESLVEFETMAQNDVPLEEPAPAEKWLTVNHLVVNSKTLPSIPEMHRKIIGTMNRPDASISEVSTVAALDASLSARLIKMANSAYYGSNHQITSVAKAGSMVGIEDLKTFVKDTPVLTQFSDDEVMNADMYSMWRHNLAVSIFARFIAQATKHPDDEYLALLGLLHDIGKLVIYIQVPELYAHICRYSSQNKLSSLKIERKVLGFYHNLVSLELLKHWNYSKITQDIVYYHHSPENAVHPREAYIIHLADALAHAIGFTGQRCAVLPAVHPDTLNALGLKKKMLHGIIAQAQQRIADTTHTVMYN